MGRKLTTDFLGEDFYTIGIIDTVPWIGRGIAIKPGTYQLVS